MLKEGYSKFLTYISNQLENSQSVPFAEKLQKELEFFKTKDEKDQVETMKYLGKVNDEIIL